MFTLSISPTHIPHSTHNPVFRLEDFCCSENWFVSVGIPFSFLTTEFRRGYPLPRERWIRRAQEGRGKLEAQKMKEKINHGLLYGGIHERWKTSEGAQRKSWTKEYIWASKHTTRSQSYRNRRSASLTWRQRAEGIFFIIQDNSHDWEWISLPSR